MEFETKDMIHDKIFEFVYGGALKDATNQKAFESEKAYLKNNKEAIKIVKEYVNNIFDGKTADLYDCAIKIQNSFDIFIRDNNQQGTFTFGNAQKLINMTFKYLYNSIYFNSDLREKFKNCHCPIDSKIIDKVKEKLKEDNDKRLSNFKNISWSKIDESKYQELQDVIKEFSGKENILPIEFDYLYWE